MHHLVETVQEWVFDSSSITFSLISSHSQFCTWSSAWYPSSTLLIIRQKQKQKQKSFRVDVQKQQRIYRLCRKRSASLLDDPFYRTETRSDGLEVAGMQKKLWELVVHKVSETYCVRCSDKNCVMAVLLATFKFRYSTSYITDWICVFVRITQLLEVLDPS